MAMPRLALCCRQFVAHNKINLIHIFIIVILAVIAIAETPCFTSELSDCPSPDCTVPSIYVEDCLITYCVSDHNCSTPGLFEKQLWQKKREYRYEVQTRTPCKGALVDTGTR